MNLQGSYDYITFELNRDSLGSPFTPEHFNVLLKIANDNYYDSEYKKLIEIMGGGGIDITTKMFNDSPLRRFLSAHSYDYGNIVPTLATLPADLKRTLGGTIYWDNVWRPADFLDIESFNRRRYNVMAPSPKRKPIFVEWPGGYQFVPKATRKARVDYLRAVLEPLYDYCIGVDDDNIIYMPVGSHIKIETAAIWSLYDVDDVLLVSNVAHLVYPGVTYTSTSIELDWDKDDRIKISDNIIALAAVRARELNVAQVAAKSANE